MMEFEKVKSTLFKAIGLRGFFQIKKSKGLWWPMYWGENKAFYLPPQKTLNEARDICKENDYWEDK